MYSLTLANTRNTFWKVWSDTTIFLTDFDYCKWYPKSWKCI